MMRIANGLVLLLLALGIGAAEVPDAVTKRLAELVPDVKPDEVRPAEMPGLYVVTYGPRVLYMSADGRYLLRGDLLDVEAGENLTENQRRSGRLSAIERYSDSMIVFAPEKVRYTINVFTDVDCGYCAKMHSEMAQYNERGISVRYLAYPRRGVPSSTYNEMVSVWCAADQHSAMTDAKAGRRVAKASCANRVAEHYRLGDMLGVRGTPTIVLETGDLIPGYAPPDELLKVLRDNVSGG
ncbi:MAG: thioredoxin fold domain-containing protein [Pseudomonadota bacterium]